jgi:hypothetical protein
MSMASLSVNDLAQRCEEETARFRRQQPNDPQFCFELMRRALFDGLADAFTRVYQICEPQVVHWVQSHTRLIQTGESADFFVSTALSNFYFALRGPKFAQFASLAHILSYLKLCTHTAIVQYLRDQRQTAETPLDEVNEPVHVPDLGSDLHASELWAHICRLLPSEEDRRMAHCVFVQDLKPAQIVQADPARWRNEREVSVALQRIRRILRRDAELRQWAGAQDE